jgi:hypothetical protein
MVVSCTTPRNKKMWPSSPLHVEPRSRLNATRDLKLTEKF